MSTTKDLLIMLAERMELKNWCEAAKQKYYVHWWLLRHPRPSDYYGSDFEYAYKSMNKPRAWLRWVLNGRPKYIGDNHK
jgi:hypothetical protein